MNNPTTGTAHNQHVISSQVHAVFAIDNLEKTIKKFETENQKLQKVMLALTLASSVLAVVELTKLFL